MGQQGSRQSRGETMNPHLPFIIGAYGIFIVVLTYCALVPIIRGRKIREQVKRYHMNRSRNDTQT